MDNEKIYDLIEKMYINLDTKITDVKNEIGDVESRLRGEIGGLRSELKGDISGLRGELQEFRQETNDRFDRLENKIDDVEANNADRHIAIYGKFNDVNDTLNKIEIVTSDNWGDIAMLKRNAK